MRSNDSPPTVTSSASSPPEIVDAAAPGSNSNDGQAPNQVAEGASEASSKHSASSEPPKPKQTNTRKIRLLALALLLGPPLLLLLAFSGDQWLNTGKIARGVRLANSDLSLLEPGAARAKMGTLAKQLEGGSLTLQLRKQQKKLKASDIATQLLLDKTLEKALAIGRQGSFGQRLLGWLRRLRQPQQLRPSMGFDPRLWQQQLNSFAQKAIQDPPYEGGLRLRAGQLVAEAPRSGWIVDATSTQRGLESALAQLSPKRVPIKLLKAPAQRKMTDISQALERARALCRDKVTLLYTPDADAIVWTGPPPKKKRRRRKRKKKKTSEPEKPQTMRFELSRNELVAALRTRLGRDRQVELYFEHASLKEALDRIRPRVVRPAIDARFAVDKDDRVQLHKGNPAVSLDDQAVATAALKAASSGSREQALPTHRPIEPTLSTEQAKSLNIRQLVSKFTTSHPCCQNRVQNIHRIADMINNTVLRPGETFSINKTIGPRTSKKGFLPAPTIVLGEMKDTVGGGISQFATTFFNAAFYGAYEILERAAHSYYFDRYPAGLEATLSYPKPDVIIRNDTRSGLLIRCLYTATTITIKFYGDNEGRKVRRKRSPAFNFTDPPVEYMADDTLDPDKEKVYFRGRRGWSIKVARIIEYPDGKTKEEGRRVIYKPRVRKVRVHSCMIPKGEEGHTGDPCPEEEGSEAKADEQAGGKAEPKATGSEEAAPSGDQQD